MRRPLRQLDRLWLAGSRMTSPCFLRDMQEQVALCVNPWRQPPFLARVRYARRVSVPSDLHMFPEGDTWDSRASSTALRRS